MTAVDAASPTIRLRRAHAGVGVPVITAVAVGISLVALLPFAFILWVTIETGWETAAAMVFRERVATLLGNTAILELLAVPGAIVVGLALAWLTERTDVPARRLWQWLAVAPLAVPAFVQGYAWTGLFPWFHGLAPAVLLSVLSYFPFVYLPIAAQLARLDRGLEDTAGALGLSPGRIFWRVILPQLRVAICGGALLVALHLLAEYGLLALIRFDTFTTAIVDQFQSSFNGPAANMLAGVLVACCLGVMLIEMIARGDQRYARVGSGVARHVVRRRLGRWRYPAIALPVLVSLLALGVPLVTLSRWLMLAGPGGWLSGRLADASIQTAAYALAAGVLTTAVAFPMAWLSVRRPGRLQRALEACHYYVGSVPGVVVGLALVTVTVRVALPLYQTVVTVLLAYLLLFLPRAVVGLRAGIAQAPMELEWAAASLGRTPLRAILATTVRIAVPGAAAAIALVAMGVATELTATLMLAPTGTQTLATEFWALTAEINYVDASPYAVALIGLSLPLTLLLNRQVGRVAGT